MSVLREQAVQMIGDLSDENVSFLIEIIQRLMPQKLYARTVTIPNSEEGMKAFKRLNAARNEIKRYLPEDFLKIIERKKV